MQISNEPEKQRGLTGLANCGNTCYMNSAIQCLRTIPGLTEYFLRTRRMRSQSDVVKAYGTLVFEMWNENQTILPKTFMAAVSAAGFKQVHRQHDSQEFLIRLMDMLHQGLRVTNSIEQSQKYKKEEQAWYNFLKHDGDSILIRLFWAQLISVVRCENCGTESSTFDPYSYLSLPLPMLAPVQGQGQAQVTDIVDCFDQFGEEDLLTGVNCYDCDKCKQQTDAVRTMDIWSLPKYLLVHLKRFNNQSKDNRPVTYPLNDFKIGRWAKNPKDRDATYRLLSVCCHVGGLHSGHYFAYCRHIDNDVWYKYDDTRVTKVKESELMNLTKQPYYFVYEKMTS